jgi:flagellar hook-associated protein 1 FlgK
VSLDAALQIATSGLRHTSRQMGVASQNVANAAVEGYTRKQAEGETRVSGGVRTQEARRAADAALRADVHAANAEAAGAALRDNTLSPIAALQGKPEDGQSLGGLVGALRDSFVSLRASPDDTIAQRDVVTTGETLAGRLNLVANALDDARQSVQDTARADVDTANGLLRDVARLNVKLVSETSAGRSGDTLRDQRDVALNKLSSLLDIRTNERADGSVMVLLRGGAVIPLDPEGSPLGLADSLVAPGAYHGGPEGGLPGLTLRGRPLEVAGLGGRIGEAMTLRDETLPRMAAELDTFAATLAGRFREQGVTLFTDTDGGTPPSPGGAGAVGFAGRITVSEKVAADPALIRDGTPDAPGYPANPSGVAGFSGLLDKVLAYTFGDRRGPTEPHAATPRSGLGPDGKLTASFAAPTRLSAHAAALVAAHASDSAAATSTAKEAKAAATGLADRVRMAEGVDIDSELATMVSLQNAYSANARLLSTVQGMWDALLSAVR